MNNTVICIDVDNQEHRKVFGSLFREYAPELSEQHIATTLEHVFTLPYFHGFISFSDDKPAGIVVCFESFSTHRAKKVMNIHDFMISSSHRGKGLGKLQLKGIEQYCREKDYVKITLEVESSNLAAKSLYSSCEFKDYKAAHKNQLHWQKSLS
ncbi:GNAT family N-acetyltransferase [Vibrio sp. ZSDE26]|uniref:GNAT family N-acetyltransferase n=1 Tax=Vibrio amylolyticus TaxID=2847292 RepID=A0A9X2BIQ0_9VIBR|nr:GNAT family N-acetyltransferase [Vibrio amylolyticus]MCK6264380.1 GNAT family N-acetyltransferase [Vibrio amylolyticus]